MGNPFDAVRSAMMRRSRLKSALLDLLWAEQEVQRQRQILEGLRRNGDATTIAEELLATYEHDYDRYCTRLQIIEEGGDLPEAG